MRAGCFARYVHPRQHCPAILQRRPPTSAMRELFAESVLVIFELSRAREQAEIAILKPKARSLTVAARIAAKPHKHRKTRVSCRARVVQVY